jgi:hypothetical protein
MASLFQIRRGEDTSSLENGELYYNQTSQSLQLGSDSNSIITLAKLNELNSGSLDISGSLNLGGNLIVSGNTTIIGNLTFGDQTTDTITVVADFGSNLIPSESITYNIGSIDKKWNEIYANVILGSSITGSLSGSVNGVDVTLFSNRLNNLEIISESYNEFTQSTNQFTQSTNQFTASITESFNTTSGSLNNVSQSLLNISTSYVAISESFDIVSSSLLTFSSSQYNADSISFDLRIDALETYSSSLKAAIDVTGGDTIIKGNLIVQGTQTSLDSSILNVADKNITIASGSTSSATSDGAGIYIAGADISMSWNHDNQRIELNKDLAISGSISASTLVGIGNVIEFSTSVDSRLDILQILSSSIKTEVSNSVSGNVNQIAYFDEIHSITQFVHSFIGERTFGLGTSATSSESERLMVDNGQSFNIATFQTSRQDSYAEVNIKNFGSGSNASADLVIWNDVATDSSSYVDLGINSSNYTGNEVGYAGDGYLYNSNNDLYVGSTAETTHGHTHIFGGNLWQSSSINVYSDGTVGINTDKYDNDASTIPHSTQGFAVEISGSVIFSNNIDVSGSVSASTLVGIGNITVFSTSVDSRLDGLENFSASQYKTDSSSFDTRIDALEIIGELVASGSPVLEYETNGTLGNLLIKGATSKSIQVVDTITFEGLSQNGSDEYSATGLVMTGSITASNGFSGSINGIGNVSVFSASIDSRIVNNQPIGYVTTASFEDYTSSTNSRINAIESFTSSIDTTIKTKLNLDNVISGSTQITALLPAGVVSGSIQVNIYEVENFAVVNDAIAFDISQKLFTSSFNEYTQSTNTRLNSLEIKTGSYATTGSNIFIGTQTFTGSVYITQDLIVQGSSSLQNVTASAVNIGTNQINLNTDLPAFRYAGLNVYDSGSSGVSASLQWDSLNDQWIFLHRESGSAVVDSSILLYGPLSNDGLGSEATLTGNFLTKVENNGHGHHLTTSSIQDTGTLVTINSATQITGSLGVNSTQTLQSFTILSNVGQNLNFANDAAAAIGGVPLYGLYRNGNFIMIRLT